MPAPTPIPVFDADPVFGPVQSSGQTDPPMVNQFGLDTVLIDGYPIDAVVSEKHDFESEVTEYPVEKGADITDHVRPKPFKVSLDCFVSDAPFGAIAQHQTRQNGTPSLDAYGRLMQLRDDPEPITIVTSLHSYSDMVLQSVSFPRESGEPVGLHFTCTFVKVLLVQNIRVSVASAVSAKSSKLGPIVVDNNNEIPVYAVEKHVGEGSESQAAADQLLNPPEQQPGYVGQDTASYYFRADFNHDATGIWVVQVDANVLRQNAALAQQTDANGVNTIDRLYGGTPLHQGYNPFGAKAAKNSHVWTDPSSGTTYLTGRSSTPVAQSPGDVNMDSVDLLLQMNDGISNSQSGDASAVQGGAGTGAGG